MGKKITDLTEDEIKKELQNRRLTITGDKTKMLKRLEKSILEEGIDPNTYEFGIGKERQEGDFARIMIQGDTEEKQKETEEMDPLRRLLQEMREMRAEQKEELIQTRKEQNETTRILHEKMDKFINRLQDFQIDVGIKFEEIDKKTSEVKASVENIEKEQVLFKNETRNNLDGLNKKIIENEKQILRIERDCMNRVENTPMDDMNKKIEENVEELKRLYEIGQQKIREEINYKIQTPMNMGYSCSIDNNNKFDGNIKRLHPIIFLKIIKNRLRHVHNFDDIREILRNCMLGQALMWYNSKEFSLNSFEDFEMSFLNTYWGQSHQSQLIERLYFGKYNSDKGTSMTNYALNLYSQAHFLEPKIKEEELILFISRHFKPNISEAIAIQDIRTYEQLNNYLSRIERGITHNTNRPINSNNYENRQRVSNNNRTDRDTNFDRYNNNNYRNHNEQPRPNMYNYPNQYYNKDTRNYENRNGNYYNNANKRRYNENYENRRYNERDYDNQEQNNFRNRSNSDSEIQRNDYKNKNEKRVNFINTHNSQENLSTVDKKESRDIPNKIVTRPIIHASASDEIQRADDLESSRDF